MWNFGVKFVLSGHSLFQSVLRIWQVFEVYLVKAYFERAFLKCIFGPQELQERGALYFG